MRKKGEKKEREGLEKIFTKLSKANTHYKRNLSLDRKNSDKNLRSLFVTSEMITTEDFLFGGFSCFEAAALLFRDETPKNRFNFQISYQAPIAVGQEFVLNRKNDTKVTGKVADSVAIESSTSTPSIGLVSEPKELKEDVQGIKEIQPSVISYESSNREDLAMLFHLCCFFDRGTWLLGQKQYSYANFLTGYLSFDVHFLPKAGPLFLEAKKIQIKRKGGSSLVIEATAKDSDSNTFATTKCTLIRICPETKQSLEL